MKTIIALLLVVQLAVSQPDENQGPKRVSFNHEYRFRKANHEFNDHNSISIYCPSNSTAKASNSTQYDVKAKAPFTVEEPVLKSTESLYESLCLCPINTTTYFNIDHVAGRTKQKHGLISATTLRNTKGDTFMPNGSLMYICETGKFMCPCFEHLDCSCLDNNGIFMIVNIIRFVTLLVLSHALYLVILMLREQEQQEKTKGKYRFILKLCFAFFLYGCANILIISLTLIYDREIKAGLCGGHTRHCL